MSIETAFTAHRSTQEWENLFTAAVKEAHTLTEEDGPAASVTAYIDAVYAATDTVVAYLTAEGITADDDGIIGDGISGAGTVTVEGVREPVIIATEDRIYSPEEVIRQWEAGLRK